MNPYDPPRLARKTTASTREFIGWLMCAALAAFAFGVCVHYCSGQDYESRVSPIVAEADAEIARLKARIKELEGDEPPPPDDDWDVHVEHLKLLDQMKGYARSAGTTGGAGAGYKVVSVSSLNELRNHCNQSSPRIILFDRSVDGKTWTISRKRDEIKPRDYKTIWAVTEDGSPIDLTIKVDWKGGGAGFRLNNDNFILAGLKMEFGGRPENDDAPDLIQATSTSSRFWVYRCQFKGTDSDDEDGVLDCYSEVGGTFQENTVTDCWKPHLVKGRGLLTLWENQYKNCGGRFPHVGDRATCHSHKNRIEWHWSYAMLASEDGRLYATENIFQPTKSGQYAIRLRNDGRWWGSGNVLNGARASSRSGVDFDVPYDY